MNTITYKLAVFVFLVYGNCTADVIFMVDSSVSLNTGDWFPTKQAVIDIVQGLKVNTFE